MVVNVFLSRFIVWGQFQLIFDWWVFPVRCGEFLQSKHRLLYKMLKVVFLTGSCLAITHFPSSIALFAIFLTLFTPSIFSSMATLPGTYGDTEGC